jgi:DNA invertase Pin-like site-specific DNA recombinase
VCAASQSRSAASSNGNPRSRAFLELFAGSNSIFTHYCGNNNAGGSIDRRFFHVPGAIAHFERRLIADRRKDGIAAARAKSKLLGRRPLDPRRAKAAAEPGGGSMSPTDAARLGLGRATAYREMASAGVRRSVVLGGLRSVGFWP